LLSFVADYYLEVFTIKSLAKDAIYGALKECPWIPDPAPLGSYSDDDAIFLLKDIGPSIKEQGNEERERAIQKGKHYSEMLPIEYKPVPQYIELFHQSLKEASLRLALATAIVSETILKKHTSESGMGTHLRGGMSPINVVLVSLARAGTPAGVLIKKYIRLFYGIDVPHYSISIIRDKGIDQNALIYILQRHPGCEIQFIDGWTGKGAITNELFNALLDFEQKFGIVKGTIGRDMAVLADPGYCAGIFGTREDFLIPSACLNATVSGLMSRTVYRNDLIGPLEFHGAKYYRELASEDLSNYFVNTIARHFTSAHKNARHLLQNNPEIGIDNAPEWLGKKETRKIQLEFGIKSINMVKPGVGETTRVLLRRVPWKILVRNIEHPDIKHILMLAKDRGVPVKEYPGMNYSCCGLIKSMEDN